MIGRVKITRLSANNANMAASNLDRTVYVDRHNFKLGCRVNEISSVASFPHDHSSTGICQQQTVRTKLSIMLH